eukprot:gene3452-3723_t
MLQSVWVGGVLVRVRVDESGACQYVPYSHITAAGEPVTLESFTSIEGNDGTYADAAIAAAAFAEATTGRDKPGRVGDAAAGPMSVEAGHTSESEQNAPDTAASRSTDILPDPVATEAAAAGRHSTSPDVAWKSPDNDVVVMVPAGGPSAGNGTKTSGPVAAAPAGDEVTSPFLENNPPDLARILPKYENLPVGGGARPSGGGVGAFLRDTILGPAPDKDGKQ